MDYNPTSTEYCYLMQDDGVTPPVQLTGAGSIDMDTRSGGSLRNFIISAPTTPGTYTYYFDTSIGRLGEATLTVVDPNASSSSSSSSSPSTPNVAATPTAAPDQGTDEYFQRHLDFWVPVLTQLTEAGDGGTVTISTAGQNIDHIMACVFGKLEGTNRTLVVNHQGATYRISGGNLSRIALGHNHSFSILGSYKV